MEHMLETYRKRCLELGAKDAVIIKVAEVVELGEWVRLKCQFGCPDYGKHLTCPPHLPSFTECRNMVLSYENGILVKFVSSEPVDDPEKYINYKNKLRKILARLERQLFLDNYQKAFTLHSGPCTQCDVCRGLPAAPGEKPTVCRFPKLARPAMEAMGVDVFSTVKKAGWTPQVLLRMSESLVNYGLILVD